MPKKKVYKSADTGKIVSKDTADANPKETYAVNVEGKVMRDITVDDLGKPGTVEGSPDAYIGKIKSPRDVEIVDSETFAPFAGRYLSFTKGDDSFIGIIQSFNPLVIIEHSMVNGVHSESESDVLSLEGWTTHPMTKNAVFEALY